MNKVIPQFSALPEDVPFPQDNRAHCHPAGVNPVDLDEVLHEIRQPLSTIESLAYYLEMTAADDQICCHLQRIRAMVLEANQILEHAVAS